MAASPSRKPRPPLTAEKLDELAISYVGRFATSRAKLNAFLTRKLRERGWAGAGEPPIDELTEKLVRLGYIDDRAYALAKARSLTAHGYGSRRVRQALSHAGIAEEDSGDANDLATAEAYEAALRFARRKRIGPYAEARPDPKLRERALAAMIRAGHGFAVARAVVDLGPGEVPDMVVDS
ncbi:RecX family transcriptional regulator [Sphingomonas sp. RB56-2]|uniref:Regulatory protein RecX n=1 Tax=Sphingomonas brevis TaxID=2908206 RepID=A0ABT0S5T1_9SPHN|nr:regulatory protein RecX [Sphingomonas brevis]MCL6739751.1 RecX family transcriptional regulator [Sphingomonas brevis]